MLTELWKGNASPQEAEGKEGEIYKVITTHGKTFCLRFGYYDDKDRTHEPDVIYPDFTKEPQYTEDGEPFVTMMQDACEHYCSKRRRNDDSLCAECEYFKRGEDWFGICGCPKNKRSNE